MKKVLALVLVLALATAANAGMLLHISVNGNPDPQDSEYLVLPSETAMLDIHANPGFGGIIEDMKFYVLVVDPANATISGGVVLPAAPKDSFVLDDAIGNGFWPGPENGVCGFIGDWDLGVKDPGVYVDEIIFHCESIVDALVQLWTSPDGSQWTMEDSVLIHQPEPMTIALLGLGGLFLRRR